MSRPTPEDAAVLVGHGFGAVSPQALPAGSRRHAWLDGTMSLTLLAPAGAAFDDEAAVRDWARRAWQDLSLPGDEALTREPVAWRAGRRRAAVVGVTWPVAELDALSTTVRSMAPLWAGLLSRAMAVLDTDAPWRLVVAEERALTLIDLDGGVPLRWATLTLAHADAALLVQALAHAPGPVWVAGHSLPGELPADLRAVPGLGAPSQAPAALLVALRAAEMVEPALRRAPALSRRLGAQLLATAALVLALALHAAWDAHQAWQAAQARSEARERIADAERRALQRHAAARAEMRLRLQQPWAQRWAAAEAAQPADGGWLRLEQRRDSPTLLLVGEAGTPADALAVARRIAAEPGILEARVLRSEATPTVVGSARARFELGVRLAELRP